MQNKDLLSSKSTWGVIIALVLVPLAQQIGVDLGDYDALAQTLAEITGGILFLVGQFTRKTTINSVAGVKIK